MPTESTRQLTLSLLGGFQVTQGEASVSFATDRARALLAYLAVEASQSHRRESLTALLWPDDQEKSARQNLSQTLTRVRKAIGDYDTDPAYLQITRLNIQFNRSAPITVDLLDFQDLLATCVDHDHPDVAQCTDCMERLAAAVELYRGSFLDGTQLADSASFEEWVLLTRQQTQRQALEALSTLTNHYASKGNHRRAQQYAAQQLAIEPWQESAHRQLMMALAHTGQRSAALAQFESCRRLLDAELAVEPEAATIDLAEKIRQGDFHVQAGEQPPEATKTPHTSSVSAVLTSDPTIKTGRPELHIIRSRLEARHNHHLFGVATAQAKVHALLQAEERPWIVAIEGMGGIGKTTLANEIAHSFVETERFVDIGWVSAKQEEYEPELGQRSTGRPALDTATLTDALLTQLHPLPPLTAATQEKQAILLQLLKAQPYLIVVDNLETVVDQEALIPFLRQLANPSKFLLTTRFRRQVGAEVYGHALRELSELDTLALIRHEASARGIYALAEADPEQLSAIYRVVGGNPLALKMVVGQVGFLPLPQVLKNLEEARGKRVDELYTYIYWQAWQILNKNERQLFLSMPLIPDATFHHLCFASGLDEDGVQEALSRLVQQSLVQVAGDLTERRYRLHRLTETFLMNEVLKWKSTS